MFRARCPHAVLMVIAGFLAITAQRIAFSDSPHPAQLTLTLNRGISIDRQFRTMPPEDLMRISQDDIHLIKSMGFEFVKFIVNPEPLMTSEHFDSAKTGYLRTIIDYATRESLPVVICLHPEWEFKQQILSDSGAFAKWLAFTEGFARFLAASWTPKQLAFQLLTEPGGNKLDWNTLQPQLWQAVRRVMPEHTLILAGDQTGKIDGLVTTEPVNDPNVMYSFTYYDPFVLTLQGAEWLTPKLWSYLGDIPYPSSPEIITEHKPAILARIPEDPPDWRAAVDGMLNEYGEARWNKDKINRYVGKLAEWNAAHGGGLKIWCAEFGCYQRTIAPEDRYRFLQDVRDAFEKNGIGWAYWSYNETLTVMAPGCKPFGPAKEQTPDAQLLKLLLGK